jgi:hypothetical protein
MNLRYSAFMDFHILGFPKTEVETIFIFIFEGNAARMWSIILSNNSVYKCHGTGTVFVAGQL